MAGVCPPPRNTPYVARRGPTAVDKCRFADCIALGAMVNLFLRVGRFGSSSTPARFWEYGLRADLSRQTDTSKTRNIATANEQSAISYIFCSTYRRLRESRGAPRVRRISREIGYRTGSAPRLHWCTMRVCMDISAPRAEGNPLLDFGCGPWRSVSVTSPIGHSRRIA